MGSETFDLRSIRADRAAKEAASTTPVPELHTPPKTDKSTLSYPAGVMATAQHHRSNLE